MSTTSDSKEITSSPATSPTHVSTPPASPTLPTSSTLLTSSTAFSIRCMDDTEFSAGRTSSSHTGSSNEALSIPPLLSTTPPTNYTTVSIGGGRQPTLSHTGSSEEITITPISSPNPPAPSTKATYSIKPSGVLKSSTMGRLKRTAHKAHHDLDMRLAASLYRLQQNRKLRKASRRRAAAEIAQYWKQDEELQILRIAAERGLEWMSLDSRHALALARATRDALIAEKDAVGLRIEEIQFKLESLQDEMEDLQARSQEATQQMGTLIDSFTEQRIYIDPRHLKLTYTKRRQSQVSSAEVTTNLEYGASDLYSTSSSSDSENSDY